MDIKETREIFDFVEELLDEAYDAKSDDGQISMAEIAGMFASTAPSGLDALLGADKLDDEIRDLDSDEARELAYRGIDLAKKMIRLVMS